MMTRHTLLDLLGTTHMPPEAEARFIAFCIWQQARPALVDLLVQCQQPACAQKLRDLAAEDAATLDMVVRQAALDARLQTDLPVMALAALQGAASEVEQMLLAADPAEGDPGAVSFHGARLVGWASWAKNRFSTGMFKTSAEEVAYGEQLTFLMQTLGPAGV